MICKKMAEDIVRFILFEECCDLHSGLRMKMILLYTTVDAIKRWGRGAKPLDSGAAEAVIV